MSFNKKQRVVKTGLVIMALLLTLSITGCADNKQAAANESDYIAIINGEVISKQEYQDQVEILKESISIQYGVDVSSDPQMISNIEAQALQTLVHEVLVIQEAKRRGIEVPESEIDAAIARIKTGFASEEAFTKALADNNLSEDVLRDQIKKDLQINEVLEQVYIEQGVVTETGDSSEEEQQRVITELLERLVEQADIEYNR